MTINYFDQSFKSFKIIIILKILISINNKLSIRIKDIRIIISRIYKTIKSDYNINIINFGLNNKRYILYSFKKYNIKD